MTDVTMSPWQVERVLMRLRQHAYPHTANCATKCRCGANTLNEGTMELIRELESQCQTVYQKSAASLG